MVDFAAEGLLDGLEGEEERTARRRLLARLHRAGVSLDELRQAVAENRLAVLPVELVLAAEGRYTAQELAERSGLSVQFLARLRQALGLSLPDPSARAYSARPAFSAPAFRSPTCWRSRGSSGSRWRGWPRRCDRWSPSRSCGRATPN